MRAAVLLALLTSDPLQSVTEAGGPSAVGLGLAVQGYGAGPAATSTPTGGAVPALSLSIAL